MILLRSVFIIALVAVAMIGVMVPSVFADEIPFFKIKIILENQAQKSIELLNIMYT